MITIKTCYYVRNDEKSDIIRLVRNLWSGGKQNVYHLSYVQLVQVLQYLEEASEYISPEFTETELNGFFWFSLPELEELVEQLGIQFDKVLPEALLNDYDFLKATMTESDKHSCYLKEAVESMYDNSYREGCRPFRIYYMEGVATEADANDLSKWTYLDYIEWAPTADCAVSLLDDNGWRKEIKSIMAVCADKMDDEYKSYDDICYSLVNI